MEAPNKPSTSKLVAAIVAMGISRSVILVVTSYLAVSALLLNLSLSCSVPTTFDKTHTKSLRVVTNLLCRDKSLQDLINETRLVVTGLYEGHEYQFRVCAENSIGLGGRSTASETVQALNPVSPPTVPVNPIVVDYNETDVTISWTMPRHDGGVEISGYVVEMLENATETWEVACTLNDKKDTTCTVCSLKTNTEYFFRVSAVNKAGSSEPACIKKAVLIKVNDSELK